MNTFKRLKKNTYFMYTFLFIVIAFFAFFWFVFYGKTFVYSVDAYLQHYSFLVKLRRFISNVFTGNGISLWSWDTSYGSDTLGNFAFVFCDPFAYIAAAFKPKFIDIGYTVSVILRLYTAGITMIAFLRYREKNHIQCIIGSIAYALSSWAVGSIVHAFFLNPLVLFPIIILGVDKIDKEKKPFVFVLAVFLSLITSFYFSYMSALLTITYIIIKYFFENENKSIADFFKRFLKFVLYALIAVAIAAPVFIPVFYTLINANKSSGVEIDVFLSLREFLRYIPSFVSNDDINGNYSFITLPMICLAMVPAAIIDFRKKINRLPSLMALICVVMAAFPIFGSIFNALSYSVGRWCYMLAFFFVWASVSTFDLDKFKDVEYRKLYKTIFIVMVIVILSAIVAANMIFNVLPGVNLYIALINLLFLIIIGGVACSIEKGCIMSKNAVIIMLLAVNLGFMYFIQYSPNLSDTLSKYMDIGQPYAQYSSSAQRVGTEIQDDDFYRIDQVENSTPTGYYIFTHTPSNESIFFGTRSIYSYISTIDNRIFEYNKDLCNSAGYYRRVCTTSNDNRSRINFLQGVKYFIGDNKDKNLGISQYAGYGYKKYKTVDGVKILKNKFKASLGYVFDSKISESDFMKYGYLDREQIMMQACVVPDESKTDASDINKNNIVLDTKNVDYEVESESGLRLSKGKIEVTSESSCLTLSTGKIENSEIYVVFKNLKKKPLSYQQYKESNLEENINSKIYSNKFDAENISYSPYDNFVIFINQPGITKRLINAAGESQAFTDIKDYAANLGYYKSTEGKITIYFRNVGEYTYDSIEVVAVSQENFNNQAKKLKNNRLKVSTLHDNYIKGTVNAENDGLLYLSIPYNKGWKVYIDGKEQETYVADIAFTGVDIKRGTHTVELKYKPVGFYTGLIMCGAGIVVFVLILLYQRHKRRKDSL